MATLEVLKLRRMGNYLLGNRYCIHLNENGANYYNNLYPAEPPNFSEGDNVNVKGKLPPQENSILVASVEVKSTLNGGKVRGLVYVSTDDHFKRQVIVL